MTWATFMAQYQAQGREKAEGYAPFHFEGMTADERARARAMLEARGVAGDTIDLDGLRLVGDAGTVAVLEAAADAFARRGWREDILRHAVLFELTGEHRHLYGLAQYLDQRSPEPQERAAHALARYLLPRDAEALLIDRLCDGRHEAAVLPLLQAWIGLREGAVCDIHCFQRYLPFIRSVTRARPHARAALLRQYLAR